MHLFRRDVMKSPSQFDLNWRESRWSTGSSSLDILSCFLLTHGRGVNVAAIVDTSTRLIFRVTMGTIVQHVDSQLDRVHLISSKAAVRTFSLLLTGLPANTLLRLV